MYSLRDRSVYLYNASQGEREFTLHALFPGYFFGGCEFRKNII